MLLAKSVTVGGVKSAEIIVKSIEVSLSEYTSALIPSRENTKVPPVAVAALEQLR